MRGIWRALREWWEEVWFEPSRGIFTMMMMGMVGFTLLYLWKLSVTGFWWVVVYILLGAGVPVESLIRMRNRRLARLRREHICLNCGYDCRVTPGRCPECGRAPGELV